MMKLKDAWLTLGKDPEEIYAQISSQSSISSKVETISNLFNYAKTISKKLLAQSHPDRNPGDFEAENRFKRIQQALNAIEFYTNEFKNKAQQQIDDKSEDRCYIQFE